MNDIIIIGAGVIGATIARELSKYKLEILLLEKEEDVSCGSSKANSGIIHGGFDDKQGTLKSKLVRLGNRSFEKLNNELNFGYEEIGSLVLAFNEEEEGILKELLINGMKNGINDLKILSREEILEIEPNVNEQVYKALYCPSSGVASPYELTIALCENAIENGVKLLLNREVIGIEKKEDFFNVFTNNGVYEGKLVVNAGGVYSDKISEMINAKDFKIVPRKGEYVLLNRNQGSLVNHVLFQVPTPKGKGILVTRTYHGNLMLGPNAQEIEDRKDINTDKEVLNYIVDTARKSVPNFNINMTITSFSGIRASSSRKDFIIEESSIKGFINVAGIESPGLTSSPAIGRYVIDIIKNIGMNLIEKDDFNPYRKPIIKVKDENFKGEIDGKDPKTNIICRCEKVTEREIVDALNRGIDIYSTDGIKRRTRAGMGPCQGNFCQKRVAKIISREKNIKEEEVTRRGLGSSVIENREGRNFFK